MLKSETLELQGLIAAPSQVCGAFRLVPLIRQNKCSDVHLFLDKYDRLPSRVKLDDHTEYWSIIPHGFILDWSGNESSTLAVSAQIRKAGAQVSGRWPVVQNFDKMVKRINNKSIRMLPMHLSMEYFLGLCFGGPGIAWDEYSEYACRVGLGFRIEWSTCGRSLYQFEQALRQFEINDGQVGVLVYAAEELASAFVVPTPEDYRAVHNSLLEDFYGNLIYHYALSYASQDLRNKFDFAEARVLSDLRQGLSDARKEWSEFSRRCMAGHLCGRSIGTESIYKAGSLLLQRFMTELDLNTANTVGERLVRPDGELLYLKTYRLDRDQARRAWWLSQLAKHDWHLQSTAKELNMEYTVLLEKIDNAGFGYLLKNTRFFQK